MDDNSESWINIADIMSALMMIFMFISIAFLYQLQNEKEIYRIQLNKALHKEFDANLEVWNAEITKDNIFRFSAPFKEGSEAIPKDFNEVLDVFFPRYIKVLTFTNVKDEIEEIRVEGHTSSGWGRLDSHKVNYLKNMDLSQKRANNVLSYSYSIDNPVIKKNRPWLEKRLRANGMAFSNLIYLDKANIEQDKQKSRRVEFRVTTKDHM